MIDYAVREAQKAGMDDAIARLEEHREAQIKFHNNDISVIKEWQSRRLSLFMAADTKRLLFTLENPDSDAIKQAVATSADIISLLAPTETYHGIGQPRAAPRSSKRYDAAITDTEGLVALAEETIARATDSADTTAGVVAAGTEHRAIATSAGIQASDDNSWATLSVRAFTEAGGSGHAVSCARDLEGLHSDAGAAAAADATRAGRPHQGERGTYDIVFSSLALANLMQHVATAASAFSVDAGMSFLAGQLGEPVASPSLTMTDSGIHPEGIASHAFDDEGVATGETTILDHGQLTSYLHNTSTACHHDTETTANAGLVAPHPWNVVVAAGDASLGEMISQVEHGLLVTNVWYTRFQNYRTGDFSTIPRDAAITIENGELRHAVTGIRISDALPRLLSNIERLGREQQQIHWWEVETPVFTPAVLVRDVPVTRSFR